MRSPDRPHLSRPKYRMHTKGGSKCQSRDNKDLIKRGYEAFAAGDIETVMSLFDDDIEWVQPGESAVSGTFHGKTEVMEHLGRLAEKSLTVNIKRLIAEGDTVVAITEVTRWRRNRRGRRRVHHPQRQDRPHGDARRHRVD